MTTYNTAEIQELIDAYPEARTQRERRQVETAILEATVWQLGELENEECGFAAFSEDELRRINGCVPDNNQEIKRLLRRPYLKRF
ncbi:hypothetical protein C483_17343 [Natrialba hulunbeirensis JCM 10989]|uniref:Uncharacterized protein n=1 Tax=Natrialba hulunbeirensis JCM 10989 TaxID=1227493 RepID=L9ZNP5_9EURY|nr:hypothetical protein [Natrialba hulunbeirensis]ELY87686.1 hypothetical protein C483_17343 [Natrialba hulunbeirensis JCM 10989]